MANAVQDKSEALAVRIVNLWILSHLFILIAKS